MDLPGGWLFPLITILGGISAWYLIKILQTCCRCWLNFFVKLLYKQNCKLTIKRLGFSTGFLLVLENGNTLEVENIWISSSLFHSCLKSLITICINDIRFQGDAFLGQTHSRKKPSSRINFLQWIPKSLITKLISVHANNLSIMQLGKPQEEFLLHISFQELSLYFESAPSSVWINSCISSASIKVFKHLPLVKDEEQQHSDSCLGHLSTNIRIRMQFSWVQNRAIECLMNVVDPELILYEGFTITQLRQQLSGISSKKETSSVEDADDTLLDNETVPQIASSDNGSFSDRLKKVPEVSMLKIYSFSMKFMKEGGHRAFTMNIKSIEVTATQESQGGSPSFSGSFTITEVLAACNHLPLAQLQSSSIHFKVINKIIVSQMKMSSLNLSYDREDLQYWLGVFPLSTMKKPENTSTETKISTLLNGWHFQNKSELKDMCIVAKLPGCRAFSAGLTSCHFSVGDCFLDSDENAQIIDYANFLIRFDIALDTLYFKIGEEKFTEMSSLKVLHYWDVPLSVGTIVLKVKLYPEENIVDCAVLDVQAEWSPNLANLINDFRSFARNNQYVNTAKPELEDADKTVVQSSTKENPLITAILKRFYSVALNCRSLNIFCRNSLQTAIVVRVDALKMGFQQSLITVCLEGLKFAMLSSTTASYQCIKTSEMNSFVGYVSNINLTQHFKKKETLVEFSEHVVTSWNTTFHMCIVMLLNEIEAFRKQLNTSVTASTSVQVHHRTKSRLVVVLQGNISIGLILSNSHNVVFRSCDISLTLSQNIKSAQSDCLTVLFDDHEIFTFKEFALSLTPSTEQHAFNRSSFKDLEQAHNRVLNVNIEEFKVIFPYEYNFSEAFTEEFLGIVKWLKQVHKKKKVPFTLDSPLPPDLSIKAKLWTIEIQDDPFEVKLKDNSELLEDEYHESLKRKKMLDEKIDETLRTDLLLPVEKMKALYNTLAQKNAEIYVMRSKQLYKRGPMRTSLAMWQLEDIDILAIADISYHGTERVIHHMKKIDAESPYPEEGLEFSTLWARKVRCSTSSWTCNLRDFPQYLLTVKGLYFWGFLIGAEQEGPPRANRSSVIQIQQPWSNAIVKRNMPSLKFYHDLTFDMEDLCMSYGPCWEPPLAQFGLSMEYVSRPSLDPSPALPWWDKMRLLFHGRLILSTQHLTLLMRASPEPYNTTEQMELTWSDVIIEWTTGKILTKGNMDVYVHTASKYDDCRVLNIPNLKLSINMDWLCLGNPHDHHSVIPCAPDKIPEYSINQEHDSYRAYRSQNMNLSISFETKVANSGAEPSMLLYSSTLRWIENLKMIMSGVTRLTKRGKLFDNTKPRKPQLSRHYRNIQVSLNLQKFHIFYWMSFAKRQGLKLTGGRLALSSENTLSLVPVNDGLKHRPQASWNIGYFNCELCDSEIWLYDWMQEESTNTAESFHAPVEKSYFLSVNRVSYGREEIVKDVVSDEDKHDTPTHRLVVHGLQGAWTKHNRNVVLSLYDSYTKNGLLKRNLSTDALRGFKVETQNTPQKHRSQSTTLPNNSSGISSPISQLQSGHSVSMLQKLISDAEVNPMVFTEELEGSTREQVLYGVAACQTDDVLQKKWLIELVNSQVVLKGCETSGYVIVSAAKAQILQRIHRPVWKDRSLVSKTTWVGSFECMQYYATVDAGEPSPSVDNVLWLSVDNIDGRDSMVISDLADLVGSGHSVGGVVSNTVGAASDPGSGPIQLQRIVSRCGCQFFFASYGENVDSSSLEEVPPLPESIDLWEEEVAVDSFTLTHHDLEICTNSLQYAMILDLVNNLLLYVEPRKKEAFNKLQYMRFQLQLRSVDDQKEPILQLQEKLRSLVPNLRRLEREAYVMHRLFCAHPEKEEYLEKLQALENSIYACKEQLNTMNEELTTMICCFKETQIIASKSRLRATSQEKGITVARRAEVCFKHAQWRLTLADGQLGIADLVLSNFLYSKVTKTDDSVEHLLEIGYVNVTNLLPNQLYKHVLQPTEVKTTIPLDRQCMLRIYCREKAPVAGISVKEHLEVNIIPFTIGLTDAFYKAMLKFFFPGRDTDKDDHQEEQETSAQKKKGIRRRGHSIFYSDREDIEKMKERADKNHTFFYIKIPEVPLRVSYKGKKEKNIEDVENLNLILSTLEYHSKTWTWLDLLMALKNDAKRILLSQAIRQKLLKHKGASNVEKDSEPAEEQKASILFGPNLAGNSDKSLKRGLFSRLKKDH